MLTSELRRELIEARKKFAVDVGRYSFASGLVCENAKKLICSLNARSIMLYLPIRGEADVRGVFTLPLSFYVPVTHGVKICPALFTSDTLLTRGKFGVSVPAEPVFADKQSIDFAIVPAVAVDRDKNRVGYGKGCYDRFLADMDCVKAAAVFDFQIADGIEPRPHDIKMDYIITESGCF